jgi:transcriptional regulator with XRE-family HTH domain
MGQYEWIFVVDGVTPDVMEDIYNSYDALLSEHAGRQLLTVTLSGRNASEAVRVGVSELIENRPFRVLQSYADLVTRGDIAERTNSTVQAVGQWVRGDRLRKMPFPQPENHVAGGVWLWGTVNDWLKSVGKDHEAELDYPTHDDHASTDLWLLAQQQESSGHETRKVFAATRGSNHWHRATRSGSGSARVPTAKSSQRLNWTGTDYEVVG